jgi:hypothetical protein
LSEQDWLIKNIEIPPEGLNLSGKLPEWKFGKETWVQARVKF